MMKIRPITRRVFYSVFVDHKGGRMFWGSVWVKRGKHARKRALKKAKKAYPKIRAGLDLQLEDIDFS